MFADFPRLSHNQRLIDPYTRGLQQGFMYARKHSALMHASAMSNPECHVMFQVWGLGSRVRVLLCVELAGAFTPPLL